ncbi:HepA Superfamily II DNA/RNA helicases, SNF2 family [uncultured Caudovirales phage]|uniref:HepA Superfamily II DNA/RNA helicases, SNF2 family n=1 Tax=uncultured Caudovirales phage TaxID=2100421 RepID=A0A6J5M0U4_9CAUD|nr:HepA Superfamily II DNA/RNA helicases, SNF2 family [uncultured Caudovirales phage]
MLKRSDLHDYQLRAVDFISDRKRCALWLDMGLGKSVTTLTAISDLIDSFQVNRTLVIAPLRVANTVWKQEAAQWEHLKHLSVKLCTGSEKARLKALQSDASIYVINRENVPWLVQQYGKRWPFDCVVIDEASSFKNASSQRFKALRKTLPETEYMILLTGTPSPNSLLDLWPQMYLIDFGNTLGRTMTAYKQRFFEPDFMGYKFTPRAGAAEKIQELLKPHVLSMSASDYLELPKRIDLIEHVQLPPKVMVDYQNFEKTLLAELPDGEEVEAISAAVLANKLLQFCNGAIYTDDMGNWSELHTAKLDALAEIIEQNDNENILLAYNYKTDLARLQKRFPQAVVLDKNPDTVRAWNHGEIPLLLAHPASAGHGLNLQRGGSLIVWFGLSWSLELYQQFNARLHRQGQIKPVRIVHLIADGCIDERVMQVLGSKDAQQSALLKALKP